MENLNSQIALVRYHSMREYAGRIEQGILKQKAQKELIFLTDTQKFECYVKKYSLSEAIERQMIERNRKDLFHLYFQYHECFEANEKLLVHYPSALSAYATYYPLRKKAQMVMVQQKKDKTVLQYINKRELDSDVLKWFRTHASKRLIKYYDELYPVVA